MAESQKVIGNMHFPKDVIFEYNGTNTIPSYASYENGKPFTGRGSGTIGIADWYGPYVEGLPDGEFNVILGDRGCLKHCYIKGKYIEKT